MKNDGGPAFPVECTWVYGEPQGIQTGNTQGWATGMSLRDYFAAKVMQGLISAPDCSVCPKDRLADVEKWRAEIRSQNAAYCYDMADAMLKERAK